MFRFVLVGVALGAAAVVASPVAVAKPPYSNCTEAWEDGASNMPEDHPGYKPYLDIDSDGIACEFGLESGV